MNATPPELHAADELDRLLSDFFKAQLQQPWPHAPFPPAVSEPGGLVTLGVAEGPRSRGRPAKASGAGARARFTLATSVALVLGTGWFLADGLQPISRSPLGAAPAPAGLKFLPAGTADGQDHPPLKKIDEDKAKDGNGGIKLDVGGIE